MPTLYHYSEVYSEKWNEASLFRPVFCPGKSVGRTCPFLQGLKGGRICSTSTDLYQHSKADSECKNVLQRFQDIKSMARARVSKGCQNPMPALPQKSRQHRY